MQIGEAENLDNKVWKAALALGDQVNMESEEVSTYSRVMVWLKFLLSQQ